MPRKALAISILGVSLAAMTGCTQEGPVASIPQASGGSSNGGTSSSAAGGNSSSSSSQSSTSSSSQGGTSNSSSSSSQGGTSNASSSSSQGGTSNASSSSSQGGTSNASSSSSQGGTSNSSSSSGDESGGTSNASSSSSDAAGGNTDTGDSGNQGGTSSSSSSSSEGGTTSSSSNTSPQTCAHAALPNGKENFLDFSTFADGKWGSEKGDNAGLTGGTSKYSGTDSTIAYELDSTAGNLKVTATLVSKGYAGLTFWFGPCLDVSTYTGIQLTIGGTTPDKGTKVMVQTNSDYPTDAANKKGGCSWTDESTKWSTCVSPTATITVPTTPAVVKVPFSSVTGGKPNSAVDASELVGFQIQFECPTDADGCAVSATIDDIGVYK